MKKRPTRRIAVETSSFQLLWSQSLARSQAKLRSTSSEAAEEPITLTQAPELSRRHRAHSHKQWAASLHSCGSSNGST